MHHHDISLAEPKLTQFCEERRHQALDYADALLHKEDVNDKRSLPIVDQDEDAEEDLTPSLGANIMDPALAARHGVPYVHLAAFAIDVDRVREFVDEDGTTEWPFAWEVFLTEVHILGALDLESEASRQMLEDTVSFVLEQPRDLSLLGAQITFAVYDLTTRGLLPASFEALFSSWKKKPTVLLEGLAELWSDAEQEAHDVASACLGVPVTPPLAPPTQQSLESIAESY